MVKKDIRGGICHAIGMQNPITNTWKTIIQTQNVHNSCMKLVCSMYGKENYVVHVKSLELALDSGLTLKKCIG